jgi:hypothetical protein
MPNDALLRQVRTYADATTNLGATVLTDHVKGLLESAALKFNLAPDLYVDVGRLPASVTDFPALVTFLGEIQDKLAKKDNSVKNEEWETAKSGELRLYKLYVCCIHALSTYAGQATAPPTNVPASTYATAACTHARTNVPGTLAGKAKILWEKTFASEAGRTVKVMVSLLYLCSNTTVPP